MKCFVVDLKHSFQNSYFFLLGMNFRIRSCNMANLNYFQRAKIKGSSSDKVDSRKEVLWESASKVSRLSQPKPNLKASQAPTGLDICSVQLYYPPPRSILL